MHIYSYLYNPKLSAGIIATTLILVTLSLRTAPRALRNRKRGVFGPGGRPDENRLFQEASAEEQDSRMAFLGDECFFSGRRMIRMIQKELQKWRKMAFIKHAFKF
jgi:hypothetical protein